MKRGFVIPIPYSVMVIPGFVSTAVLLPNGSIKMVKQCLGVSVEMTTNPGGVEKEHVRVS
jgi:hypothetical protein